MKKTGVVTLLFLSLFWTMAAWAQLPAGMAPFTQAELDKMLADYPGFQAIADKVTGPDGMADPTSAQAAAANQEMLAYLGSKGWNPPDRFLYVMGHAFMGAANLMLGIQGGQGGGPSAVDQLKAQRKAIEILPMDEAEKAKALADMDKAIAEMEKTGGPPSADIPPEEMALIQQNMDKILAVQGVKPQ